MTEQRPYSHDLLESWLGILEAAKEKDQQRLEILKEKHAFFFPSGEAAPDRIDHILSVQNTRKTLDDSINRIKHRLYGSKQSNTSKVAA